MPKIGTMPPFDTTPPVPGVPHVANKLAAPPKPRQNMLNVRIAPLKRLAAQVRPIKPEKPGNF